MKILTLLGFIVLLTTSPMTNSIPGRFNAAPSPIYHPKPVVGSTFVFLALFLVVLSFIMSSAPKCPLGYTLYSANCGKFCYRFESTNCVAWADARSICQADGADLLEPDTCTYPFFHGLVRQDPGTCVDAWIGGFRILPALNYTTVRGRILPDNFQFWGSMQPNKRGSQACAEMIPLRAYLMNDDTCTDKGGYICQKFL